MSGLLKNGFRIGSVVVDPPLILAPMSGVTNSAFRRLIKEENPNSVGLVVTEFISIEGMTRQNLQSLSMMRFHEIERPISIQIFGGDEARMAEAARMVEASGADIVDINSGCPVPKVVKRGGGCELMRQPEHLEALLKAVRKAVKIPLTLKIRSGWDEKSRNAVEIAKMAEGCGVEMIAVHGRTRVQLYRGDADWQIPEDVVKAVKIPVVGSGDVIDADFASAAMERGVSGLMIGRKALAHPWVFSEICQSVRNEIPQARGERDILRVIMRYSELLLEDMHERGALGKLKQISSQITRGVIGGAAIRRALCTSHSFEEFHQFLNAWGELQNSSRPFERSIFAKFSGSENALSPRDEGEQAYA